MKKSILFGLIFLILFCSSVYALDLDSLAPEKIFGISSGMSTQDIVIAVATWVIVLFVVYGILKIFFGGFLSILFSFIIIVLIGYFGLISLFFKYVIQFATMIGALGIAAVIIGAIIVSVLFHFSTNKLAIWWQRQRIKLARMRARPVIILFFSLFIFLIVSQSFIYAQEIPTLPGEAEIPYALDRTQSSFSKFYEGFTGFVKNTCDTGKSFTKYVMGEECSTDWAFFLFVIFWILFVLVLYDSLSTFSTFSSVPAFLISLGLVLILASMGVMKFFSNIIKGAVTNVRTLIIFGIIVFAILAVFVSLRDKYKKAKIKKKEEETELNKDIINITGKELEKGLKE